VAGAGLAAFKTSITQNQILDIQFDHNFVTTEDPNQFFSSDDTFLAQLRNAGTTTQLVKQSVLTTTLRPFDPRGLPAFMNLPNNTPPEVGFESGFNRFHGQFSVVPGDLELFFRSPTRTTPSSSPPWRSTTSRSRPSRRRTASRRWRPDRHAARVERVAGAVPRGGVARVLAPVVGRTPVPFTFFAGGVYQVHTPFDFSPAMDSSVAMREIRFRKRFARHGAALQSAWHSHC